MTPATVLVCDDDPRFADFLCALLAGEGWTATSVTSGEECLERFAAGDVPDVLVLDHRMPGLLGLEVAARLREDGHRLPVVLCSAHLEAQHRAEVARLDLVQVNKIDTQAVVRAVAAARTAGDPYPEDSPTRPTRRR